MEQNRELRTRPQKHGQFIFDKGEKTVELRYFQEMLLRVSGYPHANV